MPETTQANHQRARSRTRLPPSIAGKNADLALRASESRYRRLFEAARDGILILDAQTGRIVDVNPFLIDLLGYSHTEYLGKHLWEIGPFKNTVVSKAAFDELQRDGYIRYEDLPLETKDGREIEVEFVSNVYKVNDEPVIQCNIREITERQHVEERLRSSEGQFRLLVENAPDAILLYDFDQGHFVLANKAAERLFGCPRDEIVKYEPQHFYVREQPDGRPAAQTFVDHNERALAGEQQQFERRILNAAGQERLCEVTLVHMPSTAGRLLCASFVDITERREAEHALQRVNRALLPLSRGNEVVVRAIEESDLLSAMCRIIVEVGYRMAWVGVPQQDTARTVTPVAWAGEVGQYLEKAHISWADEPRGHGPAGRAVRSGEPQICQDFSTDPSMAPWIEDAKKHRIASSAVLPLKNESSVFSILSIYSADTNAFDADELNLLRELASVLSFGIRALRDHSEREAFETRWRTSLEATVGAIAATVEKRDPYTAGHQHRVAKLAVAIARELQLSENAIQGIYLASLIHDVGKIVVPTDVLNKPGQLSELEFQLIKTHVQAGYEIVKNVDFPWPIGEIVLQHHERLDGSGYPRGLRSEAMLVEAKIMAVADVVDAMMSRRPYRAALGLDAALEEIANGSGKLYHPSAVASCISLFRQKGFHFD